MIEIELPWPDKRLSPNSRPHWAEKARAVAAAKDYAFWTVAEMRLRDKLNGEYQASYLFSPPDRRRRDIDNLLSSCKAYQDGACRALNIDDSVIVRTVIEFAEPVSGGKVVLRLEELENGTDNQNKDR